MLFARLARRTREHQPERITCLGIESSGSRTHDRLLRRDAHRFPSRTAVLAKKASWWKAANSASSGAKSRFPIEGKKNSFQPMSFARLPTRTHEHQPERIVYLGNEPSGSRTHDRLLRSGVVHLPFVSPGVPRNADIARIFPVPNPVRSPCCTVLIRPFSR